MVLLQHISLLFNDCYWELKASVTKTWDIFKVRYFNSEHIYSLSDRVLSNVQYIVGFVSGMTTLKLGNHKKKHTPNNNWLE